MSVGIIICGTDRWEEDAIPLIKSILEYEPDVRIVTVMNTPPPASFYDIDNSNVRAHFSDELTGYANAINIGLDHFHFTSMVEWVLVMNADVLCEGKFVEYVKTLEKDTIYGNKLHRANMDYAMPIDWIDGWIYAIPLTVDFFLEVSGFDDNFKVAGFEDADFCMRAFFNGGFGIGKSQLPFKHLENKVRQETPYYKAVRLENLEYLRSKWRGFKSI